MQRFPLRLRELRARVGRPSYRRMARLAHFSVTALPEAAGGEACPSLPVVLAYVEVCGEDRELWEQRWHAVAHIPEAPGPSLGLATLPPSTNGHGSDKAFTLRRDETERAGFIAAVPAADYVPGVRVVLGVRADFCGRRAAFPELVAALRDSQFLIGAMPAEDLRRVVTGLAEVAGLKVEAAPGELIRSEAGAEPGALPLLSHPLLETCLRRRGATLTTADYLAVGGMRSAIAWTAESTCHEFGPAGQLVTREIFLRLTAFGGPGERIRRGGAGAGAPYHHGPRPRGVAAADRRGAAGAKLNPELALNLARPAYALAPAGASPGSSRSVRAAPGSPAPARTARSGCGGPIGRGADHVRRLPRLGRDSRLRPRQPASYHHPRRRHRTVLAVRRMCRHSAAQQLRKELSTMVEYCPAAVVLLDNPTPDGV